MKEVSIKVYTLKEAFSIAVCKKFDSNKSLVVKDFVYGLSPDTVEEIMIDFLERNDFKRLATTQNNANYYIDYEETSKIISNAPNA